MQQYSLLIDTTLCLQCQACVIICKQENGYDWSPSRIKVGPNWQLNCHHCAHPACVSFCPSGALRKGETGAVLWERELCLGCKLCVNNCPYQAVNYNVYKGEPVKCLLCPERLEKGLEPACVSICPSKARRFGKKEEIVALVDRRLQELRAQKIRFRCEGFRENGELDIVFLIQS